MRLPLTPALDTKDGLSNKNARLTNCLKEVKKTGEKVVVRPGLVLDDTYTGIGSGLIPFDGRLLVIYDDTVTDTDGNIDPWPLDSLPWSSGTTYGTGDSAWYGGVLWFSQNGSNTGNTPGSGTSWGTSVPYTTPSAFQVIHTLTPSASYSPSSGRYAGMNQPLMIGGSLVVPDWTEEGWDGYQTTDGISWSTYGTQTLFGYVTFVFGGTIFSVSGYNVYSSVNDGITWTPHYFALPFNGPQQVFAHSGTVYAFYYNTPFLMSTSSDGITWAAYTSTSGLSTGFWNFFSFNGSLVAIPYAGGTMKSSSDGITWATVGSGFPCGANYGYAVIGSKLYVAGGTGTTTSVFSTTDLTTWTTETFQSGSGWVGLVGPVIAEIGGKITFVQWTSTPTIKVWQ